MHSSPRLSPGDPTPLESITTDGLPLDHPVATLMEEHRVILEKLDTLAALVTGLRQADGFDDFPGGEASLRDVAHHLVEAESHHRREEEALFPSMEKHGIHNPPRMMRTDHVDLRKRKQQLHDIAANPRSMDFAEYKSQVAALGDYIVARLRNHIHKEDNILYRMALQVLSEEEWAEVKRKCDEIGYCCFTPKK